MNVLIVGSGGFIGSSLYRSLSTNRSVTLFNCDVTESSGRKLFFLVDRENSSFDAVFREAIFDICINCSGAANVPDSLKDPWKDYELNTINVFKMLEAIRKYQPQCKFLNLSSAAVYGNPVQLPIVEDAILDPVSPYGVHKMQAEQICKSFSERFKLRSCSLRIFSAYGPGLKKQLFWDLYQKSIDNDEVSLFGSGLETRDFIFINDIIKAIQLVVAKAQFAGECINVANGCQTTIKDAAKCFYDLLQWKGRINFKGASRAGDPLFWQADITQLLSLGYKRNFDLRSGLSEYVKWLNELT